MENLTSVVVQKREIVDPAGHLHHLPVEVPKALLKHIPQAQLFRAAHHL